MIKEYLISDTCLGFNGELKLSSKHKLFYSFLLMQTHFQNEAFSHCETDLYDSLEKSPNVVLNQGWLLYNMCPKLV